MFSPYYAAARRRGPADPLAHVAMNVALLGPGTRRWAMTERSERALQRSATRLSIGPSQLLWQDGALEMTIDEIAVPWPRRLRGHVRLLLPPALNSTAHALDAAGRHRWRPIAPAARVQVAFEAPACRWEGSAYFDTNTGTRALEQDFKGWQWSREALAGGGCRIHYDVARRDGSQLALALQAGPDGLLHTTEAGAAAPLATTRWGITRQARGALALERTLEDGPFYARSQLAGPQGAGAVHESLSLDRFASRWVQALLPFRMPRRA